MEDAGGDTGGGAGVAPLCFYQVSCPPSTSWCYPIGSAAIPSCRVFMEVSYVDMIDHW